MSFDKTKGGKNARLSMQSLTIELRQSTNAWSDSRRFSLRISLGRAHEELAVSENR